MKTITNFLFESMDFDKFAKDLSQHLKSGYDFFVSRKPTNNDYRAIKAEANQLNSKVIMLTIDKDTDIEEIQGTVQGSKVILPDWAEILKKSKHTILVIDCYNMEKNSAMSTALTAILDKYIGDDQLDNFSIVVFYNKANTDEPLKKRGMK